MTASLTSKLSLERRGCTDFLSKEELEELVVKTFENSKISCNYLRLDDDKSEMRKLSNATVAAK